ncbi:MFS transporter [Modestobacter roseus]|uniref:Putative MFS family arabinose efflux permease n=1 Tax=Modestobacter roseus TaxID=1181884 RepID=A0A562IYM4_9ACTN|nr:MFS transporter [Modestobacter roseus]MQA32693.1 MFS transporter [Modestobacter roseus]TWH75684.1 putative MFS family arabinose efflux permease [Modestobacter roseus]
MFAALRVRNFRLYASANLVSLTGTWMQRIGQDWLVLQLSGGSGVALGITTALQFAPTLLFSFYGGVLADRYDKRRVLTMTQSVMGVLALGLGLLVVTDAIALWHVYLLAAALGVASSLDMPVRQSFVSEMVGPDRLANAVSLNSTVFNGARLVGPALAGTLIGVSGGDTGPAFLVNAASFAVTITALLAMRGSELHRSRPVARSRGQLREALGYTRRHPDLVLAMALAFVAGTFGFNTQITIALMAREEYGLGATAFGFLSTCYAVGSLSGALLSTRRSTRPLQRFLVVSAGAFGVLLVVAGLMPNEASFAVALVPTGAAALVFSVACNSFVQLGVAPEMRGRVLALYFTCFMGGTPLGAPVIGWVSEHLGARWGFIAGGLACATAAVVAAALLARGRRVRLELHVRPPRAQLHVAARPPVPAAAAALVDAADGEVPGEQVARDPDPHADPGRSAHRLR